MPSREIHLQAGVPSGTQIIEGYKMGRVNLIAILGENLLALPCLLLCSALAKLPGPTIPG